METSHIRAQLQQIIKWHTQKTTADVELLLQAALTAYHTARTDGLCHEGAYEIALQEIHTYLSKKATIAG